MAEIVRMSISKFKAKAKGGMELPVIVTVDGEDVFAVVPVATFRIWTAVMDQRERHGQLGISSPMAEAKWVPLDLAVDT